MNPTSSFRASWIFTRPSRREVAPFVPLRPVPARTLIGSALLGIGLITPLAVTISLLPFPETAGAFANAQQRWLDYAAHPGALFLKAVLIYPLIEEIFYRGLVLQLLRRYFPTWFAIALPTVVFAATHLGHGYGNALNALALGGLFSALVVYTRSLLPSIACHAAINLAWLFLINPAFGVLEKLVARDPTRPLPAINPLTLYPAWWLMTSLALVILAVVILRAASRSTSN